MSSAVSPSSVSRAAALDILSFPIKLLHVLISAPALIYLLTLTAMLFRPPDLKCFPFDRVGLVALVVLVSIETCVRRDRPKVFAATWPLCALLALGFLEAVTQPYEPQVWSLFVAKWIVPFVCFHIAGLVFRDQHSLRRLETFSLLVLVYLTLVSVLSLAGANSYILPHYINDESIGIHADRARGPFLQAVANGVCLNLLGLIAIDAFRRRRLPFTLACFLFLAVPLALLATKTRAVWLATVMSVFLLVFVSHSTRVRKAALGMCALAVLCAGALFVFQTDSASFAERLLDRSPVDFRTEMYEAGWQMFTEKPVFGWGNDWSVQPEIEKRVSSFRPEYYVFHNTFLELAVHRGVLGLALYAWLIVCLFRLRRYQISESDDPFTNRHFHKLWPALLLVYLVNASAVVMNYQFVNALLFTIAGILAAQQRVEPRALPLVRGRTFA